jgi:hypothetical protein
VPGVPVLPRAISLEIGGQWPVCCAGASPTEDPQPRLLPRGQSSQCPAGHNQCQVNESSGSGILGGPMRSVRNNLSWLLAVALVLQLGGIVAPVVLSASGVDIEEVCTCPGGTHGATCPMHHGKTNESQGPANPCALKSASVPSAVALLTLGAGIGIVPPVNVLHVTLQSSVVRPGPDAGFASRTELPDSPPPRS